MLDRILLEVWSRGDLGGISKNSFSSLEKILEPGLTYGIYLHMSPSLGGREVYFISYFGAGDALHAGGEPQKQFSEC
jgi:hypothetical protein